MATERETGPSCFTETCVQTAATVDPDRFLTILTAPAALRPALCVMLVLNHTLVRAASLPPAQSGAGPIASLIRLQWWREVVEDSRDDWRHEPLACAVRDLLRQERVRPETLLALIDARVAEAEGPASVADWRAAMLSGAGGVQRAIGEILGVPDAQAARLDAVGAAYGCGALRRHLPAVLGSGRRVLPDAMAASDIDAQRAFLAEEGSAFMHRADGPTLPRVCRAALLPLVLARRDLSRPAALLDRTGGARGIGDRLAVLTAGWFG